SRLYAGWRLRLTRPTNGTGAHHCTGSVGPRKRSAAGHGYSQGAACMPGGGYALPGLQTALDPTIELDP
ncbi:hypothetical protein, partial [Klebsiella pneumoniae]|uniref:hypothetical protein n=1 Tax=Klebsiella pneumoniae TaxID=573 RepID=UPI001C8D1C8C